MSPCARRLALSTSLAATVVADALLEYWDLGVENFLIRGFDQLGDVRDRGALLLPELRAGIAVKQWSDRQVLARA